MTTMEEREQLERLPDDFMQSPYEVLDRLREKGNIHHVVFPHGADVYLVIGYDEVRALFQDPRVSKDGRRMTEMFARHSGLPYDEEGEKADLGFDEELSVHMLNSDPPRHTRLRGLVSKAFTLRRMEAFRPRIEQMVDGLLDAMAGKPVVEMVSEFTLPVPIITISDVLGIPAKDQDTFRKWAVELVGAGQDPEVVEAASKSMIAYARESIEEKRRHPGDDMISALLHGKDDGDKLTDPELVTMIFLFTVAGHVTSMHTLTNGIFSLLTHPDQLALLQNDLSLLPRAVDELMRYDGGVGVATFRFTSDDIPVGDTVIPKDQILALSVLGAHRDPARFPDPNRLDVTRQPLGVLGFGHGPHFCIGQPLAKIQSETAFGKLITRYPNMKLAADPRELKWESGTLLRGLITLPVSVNG